MTWHRARTQNRGGDPSKYRAPSLTRDPFTLSIIILQKFFSLLKKEETVVSDDEPAEEMELAVQPPASYSHQYTFSRGLYFLFYI